MYRSFCFVMILICLIPFLWAQEEEVLMPVPLYVDGIYSGEIPLRINGKVLLQPRPLFEELRSLLIESELENNLSRWTEDEWVAYESLNSTMIHAEFDEAQLIFSVTIPPESRKPGFYSLVMAKKAPSGGIAPNANLSGILNLEGWVKAEYEEKEFNAEFNPELAINYADYVLEVKGGVQSGEEILFLDHLRFIKDFPSLTARAEAGDLSFNGNGVLSTSMVGLSLFRKTSLDLNYQSYPELGKTLFFPEPAEVEILINERRVRKTSVPAGVWTFQNFPLQQGPNEVTIVWEDSSGSHEESYFHIYDSGLLKKEEIDWGASVGTDSWTTFNPILLFSYSQGLTDSFTTGVNSYYSINDSSFSMDLSLLNASLWGTFSFSPSFALDLGESVELDFFLNHSYSEKRKEKRRHSFGSSLGFQILLEDELYQTYSVRGYYQYTPIPLLSFNPILSWSYSTSDHLHGLDLSMRVRTKGGDSSSIALELGVALSQEEWEPKASITYTASFPNIQQNFYAKGDMDDEKMTLSWNRYNNTDGSKDYTLGLSSIIPTNNEERFTLSVNGGYVNPLFRLNATQGFSAFFDTGELDNSTVISGGTALVYADGVFGMTRPVQGSFVIIESEIGKISVNPTSLGNLLDMDGDSPGIITSVSPYRYTTLRMVPDVLPVGSDINDYTTSVYPSYRSGTLIRAEEKVYMYAGGILTDRENRPLPLLLGEIIPVPGLEESYEKGEWPREFFTDEEGYFECYSLSPGEYLLTQKDKELTFIVDVIANESGFCDLGVVKPEN